MDYQTSGIEDLSLDVAELGGIGFLGYAYYRRGIRQLKTQNGIAVIDALIVLPQVRTQGHQLGRSLADGVICCFTQTF
jgi:hypothetical protein